MILTLTGRRVLTHGARSAEPNRIAASQVKTGGVGQGPGRSSSRDGCDLAKQTIEPLDKPVAQTAASHELDVFVNVFRDDPRPQDVPS